MSQPANISSGEAPIRETVSDIFEQVTPDYHPDESLPDIVVQNRLQRARQRLTAALMSRGPADVTPTLKEQLLQLVEAWAVRSFDDGFKEAQEFEIRCAQERDLVLALQSGNKDRILGVLEKHYRGQIIEQYGSIELRGIQISHRVILDLDEVYIPLYMHDSSKKKSSGKSVANITERRRSAVQVLARHKHILIVGAPGSGKSTLIAYIATGLAEGKLLKDLKWSDRPLPLVLLVRTLSEMSFTPEWFSQILNIDLQLVNEVLARRAFVILIDGVDEAAPQLRQTLFVELTKFLEKHPQARAVVTSRPSGGIGAIERCLPHFRHFKIADFSPADVNSFIDKWCFAAEKSVRKDASEAARQARDAARDLKSRISFSRPVQRIAVNPLLTTILCVVHRFLGRSIPEHRVTLYEKCTDALLYEWDRAKFQTQTAVGGLDAPQKRMLLRGVARSLHEKHAAEISEQAVIQHFGRALPILGRPESDAERIVHEIRDRSGLLVERRPGYFAFSHLTFQEYLTALDYVASKSWLQLVENCQDPWWHEVAALSAGASGSEPALIIDALLRKGNRGSTLLAAQCAETALDLPIEIRERVEKDVEMYLPPTTWKEVQEIVAIGMTAAPLLMRYLQNPKNQARLSCLQALNQIDYEPAIPIIGQCADDDRSTHFQIDIPYRPSKDGRVRLLELTVGDYATIVLLQKAYRSESSKRALAGALRGRRLPVLRWMRARLLRPNADEQGGADLGNMLDSAIAASAGREKKSSKRPRNAG